MNTKLIFRDLEDDFAECYTYELPPEVETPTGMVNKLIDEGVNANWLSTRQDGVQVHAFGDYELREKIIGIIEQLKDGR